MEPNDSYLGLVRLPGSRQWTPLVEAATYDAAWDLLLARPLKGADKVVVTSDRVPGGKRAAKAQERTLFDGEEGGR